MGSITHDVGSGAQMLVCFHFLVIPRVFFPCFLSTFGLSPFSLIIPLLSLLCTMFILLVYSVLFRSYLPSYILILHNFFRCFSLFFCVLFRLDFVQYVHPLCRKLVCFPSFYSVLFFCSKYDYPADHTWTLYPNFP